MNFKLFLIEKQQQKGGQILLSELDRRYKEHEICVIMAKSHLDNLVGIKPKFIACPHWQCSPKQERMTVCVTSLLMMSAAKKLTPAMMCFNSLFFGIMQDLQKS